MCVVTSDNFAFYSLLKDVVARVLVRNLGAKHIKHKNNVTEKNFSSRD